MKLELDAVRACCGHSVQGGDCKQSSKHGPVVVNAPLDRKATFIGVKIEHLLAQFANKFPRIPASESPWLIAVWQARWKKRDSGGEANLQFIGRRNDIESCLQGLLPRFGGG